MERFQKTNLSAYLNFLLAKYEAYTGAVRVRSKPYFAMVDPCDICQLRCPTCPTGIENEGRRQHAEGDTTYRSQRSRLSPDLFDALLDEMSEYLFLIEFHSWGEPLLNMDTTSFIRKASTCGIETHMHTNLSLALSAGRIDDLATSGLDFLIASVDGFSQEVYEKFRVGGDVELVKANLERLADAVDRSGSPTSIVYKYLVFSWNEHEIAAARRFSEKLGISFQIQDACVPDATWLPSYRKHEKSYLTAADVGVLDAQWAAAGKAGYWKDHERHAYWMPVDPGLDWIPTAGPRDSSFCGWHYSVAVIQPGGHVAPCCITPKETDRFGTVVPGRVRLADVWNSDSYRKSRAAFAGVEPEGLDEIDTVCTRCYFPDALKHVYSGNDVKVVRQYVNVFAGSDLTILRALELLLKGSGKKQRKHFVEFFERNLTGYFENALTSQAALSAPSS